MKIKTLKISKTVRRGLQTFRERILKLPYTKQYSNLVDCVDFILEGTADGQAKNSK
jgi:hypothetical protein